MKKIFLIFGLIITSQVANADQLAANQAQSERPVAPTNTCGKYNYNTQYSDYMACTRAYNGEVVHYQNQVNAYNQLNYQNPSGQITTNGSGLLETPKPPQNMCGSNPPASDIGAYHTWNGCNSNYQSQLNSYNKTKETYDRMNNDIAQSATLQAQQNAQAADAARLAKISDQTVTGSLNQVQSNNQGASKIYAVAGAALAGYAVYSLSTSYGWFSSCGPWSPASCALGVSFLAAAVAYTALNKKANNQVKSLGENKVEVCVAQNKLSGTQANCQFLTPGSPVAIPEVTTPPDPDWYDPTTGQCKSGAPKLCGDIQAGDNGYKPNGITVPKIDSNCAGGGVSCMAGPPMTITQTPKGPRYSIKDKNGKEYSFYESDVADEKSMIAAGMSAAAAKKLSGELALLEGSTNTNLASNDGKKDGAGKPENLGLDGKSVISFGDGGAFGADGLDDAARARRYKDSLNAAKDLAARKPSAVGMSKNFHGDLIGLADDDIFGMMNRRYQLKDEQDTFITPVKP